MTDFAGFIELQTESPPGSVWIDPRAAVRAPAGGRRFGTFAMVASFSKCGHLFAPKTRHDLRQHQGSGSPEGATYSSPSLTGKIEQKSNHRRATGACLCGVMGSSLLLIFHFPLQFQFSSGSADFTRPGREPNLLPVLQSPAGKLVLWRPILEVAVGAPAGDLLYGNVISGRLRSSHRAQNVGFPLQPKTRNDLCQIAGTFGGQRLCMFVYNRRLLQKQNIGGRMLEQIYRVEAACRVLGSRRVGTFITHQCLGSILRLGGRVTGGDRTAVPTTTIGVFFDFLRLSFAPTKGQPNRSGTRPTVPPPKAAGR